MKLLLHTFIVILMFVRILQVKSQFSFQQILPSSCTQSSDYYDAGILQCRNCSTNQVSDTSGYSCTCQNGFARNINRTRVVECRPCTPSATTPDGYFCSQCTGNATLTNGLCTCAAPQSPAVTYSASGISSTTSCSSCPQSFLHSTGNFGCYPCPDCASACPNRFFSNLCFEQSTITTLGLNTISTASESAYVTANIVAAYGACRADESGVKNQTGCNQLANLCVMEHYDERASACIQYGNALSSDPNDFDIADVTEWRTQLLPWLYYVVNSNSRLRFDQAITQTYSFSSGVYIDLVVAQYRANGTFLGISSVQDGLIQLCKDTIPVMNAAYEFGTSYDSTCSVDIADLLSSSVANTYFDMYVRYTSTSGQTTLYPVPVLVSNYVDRTGNAVNQELDTTNWQFVKRFFLIDTLSGNSQIRYAQRMQLEITLKPATSTGSIYPPMLRMTYQTATFTDGTTGTAGTSEVSTDQTISFTSRPSVETTFLVIYLSDTASQNEGIMISMSIFGVLAVLYAMVEAGGWRRRQGLPYVELTTIVRFLICMFGNVANVFFVVTLGYATVLLLFFKGQSTANLYVPENGSYQAYLYLVFIAVGFSCKATEILVMIFNQSFIDIFFIDWERPRGKRSDGQPDKISIWRTYFIANEWNEIQTCRKINPTFQLFAVIFFLEILNFKNLALLNASNSLTVSPDVYQPAYSVLLRFAVSGLVYVIVDVLQVIYYKLIHERFISDKMRDFVDLCSVSNVSVFILSQNSYGYYIHGRSVHGKADTDMAEMNLMMQREGQDLVPKRGLQTGSENQVFEILIPPKMRLQYDKIYEPLESLRAQPAARGVGRSEGAASESLKAYSVMKNFLTSFLDHSLKELDYIVREKLFLEKVVGIDFQDPVEKAFFTIGDDDAFSEILFYGREIALLVFDVLLFSLVDYGSQNFLLAAVVTYVIGGFLRTVRNQLARHNLANKTLIDKRFLI